MTYLLLLYKQHIAEIFEALLFRLLTFTLCAVQETESWKLTSSKIEIELTHPYHFSASIGWDLIFLFLCKEGRNAYVLFS